MLVEFPKDYVQRSVRSDWSFLVDSMVNEPVDCTNNRIWPVSEYTVLNEEQCEVRDKKRISEFAIKSRSFRLNSSNVQSGFNVLLDGRKRSSGISILTCDWKWELTEWKTLVGNEQHRRKRKTERLPMGNSMIMFRRMFNVRRFDKELIWYGNWVISLELTS